MSSSVLVVDDDVQAAKLLAGVLTNRGYEVRTTDDPESALSIVHTWCPSILIADLKTRNGECIELCQRIREISSLPVIVMGNIAGRGEVAALDSGADDYLLKPVSVDTLLARVRAALRRSTGTAEAAALGVGEFHIDFHDRRVRVHGQPVRLTPKEFDLFVFMARHPNRVLRHKTLLGAVWGEAFEEQPEYLRVFVGQLRKKLESDPSHPHYLVTEPWVGYRFNPTGLAQ